MAAPSSPVLGNSVAASVATSVAAPQKKGKSAKKRKAKSSVKAKKRIAKQRRNLTKMRSKQSKPRKVYQARLRKAGLVFGRNMKYNVNRKAARFGMSTYRGLGQVRGSGPVRLRTRYLRQEKRIAAKIFKKERKMPRSAGKSSQALYAECRLRAKKVNGYLGAAHNRKFMARTMRKLKSGAIKEISFVTPPSTSTKSRNFNSESRVLLNALKKDSRFKVRKHPKYGHLVVTYK
ncbi:MAG: hypothetical protein HQ519_07930 [Planctomycetes bacterium]|nr:hypothetical protein [Planctomycetota bacterium]